MIKINKCSDVSHKMKLLVYGVPGAGKTTFACSADKHEAMAKPLIFNFEGGILAVSKTDAEATEQLTNSKDMEDLFWAVARDSEEFIDYKTIVIDSGTEMESLLLGEIVEASIKKGKDSSRTVDDVHLADYGKLTKQMARHMQRFRDLANRHVIVTALTRDVMTEAANGKTARLIGVLPGFMKKLGEKVQGYFDHVWYMKRDEDGQHKMLTQRHGIYCAKTRGEEFAEKLGLVVTNPNLGEIYDLLLETT